MATKKTTAPAPPDEVGASVPSAEDAPTKPDHHVEVMISSVSKRADGTHRINQEIIYREYADTPKDLVTKNFPVAEAVTSALIAVNKKMAQGDGYTAP